MSESERTPESEQTQQADQAEQPELVESAAVEEQPPATDDPSVAIIPATFAGMPPTAQTFFAVVNANGTLARGFGVVSSARIVAGQYQVVFSHDVRGSAYVGTIGLAANVGISPPGEIAVVGRAGVPNGVFVQTFASNGVAADRGFHLAVLS